MGRIPARLVLVLGCLAGSLDAQAPCSSAVRTAEGTPIDLAPPPGYIDVCSQDPALCELLTAGYPPSVSTLAYFVPPAQYAAYRQRETGFTRYLIAQLAGGMTAADLPDFKEYVRAQQGRIPDNTELPGLLQLQGQVGLGIVDESDSSITIGTIMKLTAGGDSTGESFALVATNTMIVHAGRVLSLYVYRSYEGATDLDGVTRETRDWIACLAGRAGARVRPNPRMKLPNATVAVDLCAWRDR